MFALAITHRNPATNTSHMISSVFNLSSFKWLERKPIREMLTMFSKKITLEIAQQTYSRHTVIHEEAESPFKCMAYVSDGGFVAFAVTNLEYIERVAFKLLKDGIEEFFEQFDPCALPNPSAP